MTHLSSSYARQDAAFSTQVDDAAYPSEPERETKRSLFSWFRSHAWEPLCPDLLTEVNIGLGRQN